MHLSVHTRIFQRYFQIHIINGKKLCQYPVYCKCKLIQFLICRHNTQWENVPSFNYIEISKPGCSRCQIWMQSCNQVSDQLFYIKRSYKISYWPSELWVEIGLGPIWEILAEGPLWNITYQKPLGEVMKDNICYKYIDFCQKRKKRHRHDSDSTIPTLVSVTNCWNLGLIKSLNSYFAELLGTNV